MHHDEARHDYQYQQCQAAGPDSRHIKQQSTLLCRQPCLPLDAQKPPPSDSSWSDERETVPIRRHLAKSQSHRRPSLLSLPVVKPKKTGKTVKEWSHYICRWLEALYSAFRSYACVRKQAFPVYLHQSAADWAVQQKLVAHATVAHGDNDRWPILNNSDMCNEAFV